jgi:hypothetical protein
MSKYCKKCGKKLAELNPTKECFVHNPALPKYLWCPVTKCTGPLSDHDRMVMLDEVSPKHGTEEFNNRAFSKLLLYPVLD